MVLNNGADLHFAQTVLAIGAENSLLRLEAPVMVGVTAICPIPPSMEAAVRGKPRAPLEWQPSVFHHYTQFFKTTWHLLYAEHHFMHFHILT